MKRKAPQPNPPSSRPAPGPSALALALALAVAPALALAPRPAAAAPPPPPVTLETGWSVDAYIDPAYESQSAQVAYDVNDVAVSVFAGRTSNLQPFRLRWSRLSGLSSWSPADTLFASTTASELLPQVARAPDGTLWLAWLRDNNGQGTPFAGPALVTSRLVGGAWSAPETVTVGVPLVDAQNPQVEFAVLGVNADSAWVAWSAAPDGDPFSLDRDLFYSVRSATGWSPAAVLSNNGLAEGHPALVRTSSGRTVALWRYDNAVTALNGARWDGAAWVAGPTDQFVATGIYEFAAAADTNDAVRLMAFVRGNDVNGLEDHVSELVWNDSGFHLGPSVSSFPVVGGAENEPPAWSGLSLATGRICPQCVGPADDREYRALWTDFTQQDGTANIFTVLRTNQRFEPIDLVSKSLELHEAWPRSAQDLNADRWYATWNAPPGAGGIRRAKFSFSQTFAGDLDLGANYIAPDTVRVTIVCTGDATGRTFELYRVKVEPGQADPPLPPPVPAQAVPLPGNPYQGRCPFDVDDFPGPGRWFYYAVLDAQGTFPERDARALQAVVVPEGNGGGGGSVTHSALLVPRPQPAHGPVSLPYDLASDGDVSVLIRDLRGRLVRVLVLGPRVAGQYRDFNAPVWDGADGTGRTARAGMYFATLAVNGKASGPGQRIVYFP